MLSTLIRPTSGEAWVAGSLSEHAASSPCAAASASCSRTRRSIARSSAAENLRFAGLLNDLLARARSGGAAASCWSSSACTEQRDRPVASLSGGMRRALDIARGVIHQPQILFLDEPTIGLDLPNRRAIWRHIARLRARARHHGVSDDPLPGGSDRLRRGRLPQHGPHRAQRTSASADRRARQHIIEVETDQPAELAEQLAPRLGEALVEGDCVHFRCDSELG